MCVCSCALLEGMPAALGARWSVVGGCLEGKVAGRVLTASGRGRGRGRGQRHTRTCSCTHDNNDWRLTTDDRRRKGEKNQAREKAQANESRYQPRACPGPFPTHWIAESLNHRITGSLNHWDHWDHWDHWIAGSLVPQSLQGHRPSRLPPSPSACQCTVHRCYAVPPGQTHARPPPQMPQMPKCPNVRRPKSQIQIQIHHSHFACRLLGVGETDRQRQRQRQRGGCRVQVRVRVRFFSFLSVCATRRGDPRDWDWDWDSDDDWNGDSRPAAVV